MTGTYDTLVNLLVNRFEVNRADIGPDVTFDELDMDSLFLVEMLLVVQSELGVAINEDTASPGDTIGRTAECIDEQLSAAAASS